MPESFLDHIDLRALADQVGTPFYAFSAQVLRQRLREIRRITPGPWIQARYAMKACSARRVLEEVAKHNIWIDAVSGNEVLRARAAGFAGGCTPPSIVLTVDVFRDNALEVIREHRILPNIGSPRMIDDLRETGYRGPIGLRVNPGFGHGHVRACDTGGPSSKHGIWHEELEPVRRAARAAGYPVVLLHAHVGSGPEIEEFNANIAKLAEFFASIVGDYPELEAVNFGGGLPHPYRPGAGPVELGPLGEILLEAQETLSLRAGHALRIEIEPGRYLVAPAGALVTQVTDVKTTRSNDRGSGHTFAMVDAGFCDLVRPAMYGSYHHITVYGARPEAPRVPIVVAGPLCESGDVFTRDASELLDPRSLAKPERGDLLIIHDCGAYGAAMSSTYNSIGKVPHVWLDDGQAFLISRRESVVDLTRQECFEPLGRLGDTAS